MAEALPENFKCETMDTCLTECKTVKVSFKWTIENFLELQQANGEELESKLFPSATGQPAYWKLRLYPRGETEEDEDSVGLFLSLQSSQSVDVRAKFTFVSKDIQGKTVVGLRTSDLRTFSKASSNWGYTSYVKRNLLTESLKRLKTEKLIIHCSIIIFVEFYRRPVSETMDMCLSEKEKFKMSLKWTIKDFLALPQVNGEFVESHVFPTADEQPTYWKLKLYPKGDAEENEGFVSLYLQLQSSESKISTKLTFVAEDTHGNTVVEQRSEFHTFDKVSKDFGYSNYVNRNTLAEALKRLTNDTLIIHCTIIVFLEICNKPASGSGFSMNASNDASLSQDLQSLLLDESYSDFVINIDDRKFKVHKNILHARSSVFAAMLCSNMEEGNSSEVTLDDVDPDVFQMFLKFIYANKHPVRPTDALNILPVADKYNIATLTLKCANVLKSRICIETAVKTLILADVHHLEELKKVAVQYICRNADVISKTEDWSQLVTIYPKMAAELFLASAVDKTEGDA